ncbi:probable LRR receptor-like serine/threonine-protein kinase At4g29180 [Neltuma alba]|uniref:probable LRR receptor-like serine/threonine-protein kinase At4g29180 n=1 Tax=Neltuma alba TaxID=207710 RepID=UPI0010A4B12F|nr:probable LRR receptor-like serine/threonine-protein kinase At4g29180 [Prosopis alba]
MNQMYLIRAIFSYGNYDNKNTVAVFDLYVGANYWTTIRLPNAAYFQSEEIIIQQLPSDHLFQVCLVNIGLDFIHIDCGESRGYIDPETVIPYQADMDFVETGKNSMVAPDLRTDLDHFVFGRQLKTLRFFPEGKRNCYTLKPKLGNNYLIRAFFAYGNYDAQNRSHTFDLYLNVDFWETVHFNDDTDGYEFAEIIHTPTTDTILVCLVNTGLGIPFISMLELRPLINSVYIIPSPSQSLLVLDTRIDVGSTEFISGLFTRFKDDVFDRVWHVDDVFEDQGLEKINTSQYIEVGSSR